jgi:CubicO group peptidase (beta-lactamase class C family)
MEEDTIADCPGSESEENEVPHEHRSLFTQTLSRIQMKCIHRTTITFGLSAFLIACLLCARVVGQDSLDTKAIDEAVHAQMEQQDAVGIAIGVIRDGEVAYLAGYGFADREQEILVDANTMFRWASISKPLTAISAAQLVESGVLDLDEDIRNLVPEFPDKGSEITTRQLLGHLGGIVHYRNGPVIKTERNYDQAQPYEDVILALDLFRESPLVGTPGAKFAYTTHGFILASAVIERAGNQPFHLQVAERITRPLELESLQPDYQWVAIPDRAVGYRKSGDKVVTSTDTDVSWKLGGGGFISNIGDLARFAAALDDPEFITPKMRELLFTPQKTTKGSETGYGMGFRTDRTQEGTLVVSHSGAQEKVRGLMVVELRSGSIPGNSLLANGLVILTNSEHVNIKEVAKAINMAINMAINEKPEPR